MLFTMSTTVSDKDKAYAVKAPPPIHSIVTMLGMLAFFVPCLPSLDAIDEVATVDTFTNRVFPELVSLELLVYTRAAFALLVLAITTYSMIPGNGWTQQSNYLPGSKLRRISIHMQGFRVLLPYTSWCWNLLGLSFALSSYIAYQGGIQRNEVPTPLLRAALLIHETAAPSTLLVSFVVAYAIWPNILKRGGDTTEISSFRTLVWHNANVIMALSEVALLGGMPVKIGHFAVCPMYGISYIFVAWSLRHFWDPSGGPQFIYFFLDTTLGSKATYVLLILLAVMMTFFGIFATVESILTATGGGFVIHAAFVVLVSAGVCRFKD